MEYSFFDLTPYEECPFRPQIPARIDIRRGEVEGHHIVALYDRENDMLCSVPDGEVNEDSLEAVIAQMGAAAFDKRHPGVLPKLYQRMRRVSIKCGKPTPEDEALIEEMNELQHFGYVI